MGRAIKFNGGGDETMRMMNGRAKEVNKYLECRRRLRDSRYSLLRSGDDTNQKLSKRQQIAADRIAGALAKETRATICGRRSIVRYCGQ